MADIKNFTVGLAKAEQFIHAKCRLVSTESLSIHIKHTRAKGCDVSGYYRLTDRRIVLAVKPRLRYPRNAAYGVGSVTVQRRTRGSRPFRLIWHEDRFDSPDDLLAFVAGHELWHFLCHSGQRKGDYETKANCNGFLWLREFKLWSGPGHPVAPIPSRPPRPDLEDVQPAIELEPWIQGELFSDGVAARASALPPQPSRLDRGRLRGKR